MGTKAPGFECELWFWVCGLAATSDFHGDISGRGCETLLSLPPYPHNTFSVLCSPDPSPGAPCLSVPSGLCPAPAPATLDTMSLWSWGSSPAPGGGWVPCAPNLPVPSLVHLCVGYLPFHSGALASWFLRVWKCLICMMLVLLVQEVTQCR